MVIKSKRKQLNEIKKSVLVKMEFYKEIETGKNKNKIYELQEVKT